MYEYPFGNGQQLNLDWFLAEWKNLLAAWEAEKNGIDGALQAEIDRAEAALADVFAARDAAAQSASDASASKDAAAQSASDASGYLATVRADANTASNAAQNAAQSESNATDSAQTALASKNAAGQSERNAAQSEANASASKDAAAQSASDASASKDAAAQSAADALANKDAAAQSASDAENAAASVESSASDIDNIKKTRGTIVNDFSNWFANLPLNKKTTQDEFETIVNRNIVNAKHNSATWANKAINLLTGEACPIAINTNYIKTNGIHVPDNSMITLSVKTLENIGQYIDTIESNTARVAVRLYYAAGETSTFRATTVAGYSGFATEKICHSFSPTEDLYILPTFFRTGDSMKQNDEITFRYDINIYSRIAKQQILANTFFNVEDLLFYATSQIEVGSLITLGTNANLRTISEALNSI